MGACVSEGSLRVAQGLKLAFQACALRPDDLSERSLRRAASLRTNPVRLVANHHLRCEVRVFRRNLRVSSGKIRLLRHNVRVSSGKIRLLRHNVRVSRGKIRVFRHNIRVSRGKNRVFRRKNGA